MPCLSLENKSHKGKREMNWSPVPGNKTYGQLDDKQ